MNLTEETFNACIERGPKAYFLACQAVGRQMAEQRSGKIINLSSTDARVGSGGSTANSAAYSSIDSMTRAIAQFQTPRLVAAILLLSLMGMGLFAAVSLIERLALPWRR